MLVSGLSMALSVFLTSVIFGVLLLVLKYRVDYLTSEVGYLREKVERLSKKS